MSSTDVNIGSATSGCQETSPPEDPSLRTQRLNDYIADRASPISGASISTGPSQVMRHQMLQGVVDRLSGKLSAASGYTTAASQKNEPTADHYSSARRDPDETSEKVMKDS